MKKKNRRSSARFTTKSRRTKRKRLQAEQQYEALETRQLLNAVPFANDDLEYTTGVDSALVVTVSSNGVLNNDFDVEGSALTATKVSDPSNGTLTLNSNGTFTYTPSSGFEGVDQFTYETSDGTASSETGMVQITVGDGLSGSLNGEETNSGDLFHDGVVKQTLPLGSGFELVYRSDSTPVVLVPIETFLTPGTAIPDSITANLTVAGVSSGDVTFNNTGLVVGESFRFVLRSVAQSTATGAHDWTITATLNYASSTETRTFTGTQNIVNRNGSEFGTGWWVNGLDRLHTSTSGALLVEGDGTTLWFEKSGSTYLGADGDLSYSTLVQNSGGDFTRTDKWGDKQNFDSSGYLTDIQPLNNSNASFTFTYDSSNRVDKIVDEFGREFGFTYNTTTGKLDSTNDFFGRDSTLTFSGDELTSFTTADETATGYTAPTWSFDYQTIGGRKFLNKQTDPALNTTEYVYNLATRRIKEILNPDHTTQNESKWLLNPTILQGLAFGSGNTMLKVSNVDASYTDEEGNKFGFQTDRFGNITSSTDASGETTSYEFGDQSLLYRITLPDPDGTGTQTSSVTEFGYSSSGDLVVTENPDGTTTTSTFDATHHGVTSYTNELGNSDSFSYFADGDVQTYTDIDGNVWAYTYDSHGNLLTETSPDPDGSGTLYSAITTTYTYDSTYYNRLTRTTWDNSKFQEFSYTTSDQIATFTDELGNVTTYEYDPLDRLTKMTLPDPDGAGTQVSPVYTYEYGANLLIDKEIDPLGNATEYEYNSRDWLTKTTLPDPDGTGTLTSPEIQYSHDKTGLVTSEILPSFNGVSIAYTYNANGQMTQKSGPVSGQTHSFVYDASGRLISETDPTGSTTTYEYDSRGRLVGATGHDPDGTGPLVGPTVSFEHNATGQLTKVTDALGRATTYSYYANGSLQDATKPDPDGPGSIASSATSYEYDSLGRVSKITDPASRIIEKQYDIFGNVTKFINPDPDGPLGALPATTVEYTYDDAGQLTGLTDEAGFFTAYAYDDLGRLTSKTLPDPDGSGSKTSSVFSYAYDAAGNRTSETDPMSNVTSYSYDNLNRRLTLTQPDPDGGGTLSSPVWSFAYNDFGLVATVTDPLSQTTTYAYDSSGRRTSATDPMGNVTLTTYDALDRVTEVQSPDPDGTGPLTSATVKYTFDAYGYLTQTEDAIGGFAKRQYDAAGQLTSLEDQSGNKTFWAYDEAGRLTMETDELGNTRSYEHNAIDRLVRYVDTESRVTLYGFEGYKEIQHWYQHAAGVEPTISGATTTNGASGTNEIQTVTLTDVTSGSFRLGFTGQTTAAIAFDGTAADVESALESLQAIDDVSVTKSGATFTITFQGDLSSTDVSQIFGDARLDSDGTKIHEIELEYDEIHRLISADDSFATYTYTFDDAGRITAKTENLTGFAKQISASYEYDANDNRTDLSIAFGFGMFGADDYQNTYTYDGLNRPTKVIQDGQGGNAVADKSVRFNYDANSRFKYIHRYENTTATYPSLRSIFTFDANDQMTSLYHRDIQAAGQQTLLADYTFTFDNAGRITTIDSSQDGVSDYTYDSYGQLLNADHATGRTDEAYTYDATGNRTGGDYVVTAKNRTTESSGYQYEYDNEGNRTKRIDTKGTSGTTDDTYENYTFDHRNRMTKAEFFDSSDVLVKEIDYTYDVFNRMVKRTFDSNGAAAGGVSTTYFAGFDGIQATLEFDGSSETDLSHRYLWGPKLDQLLSDEVVTSTSSAGDILWPLFDEVGTIRDIGKWDSTTSKFAVANHREYDSFGNLISETDSSVSVAFGFTGKWTDVETGYSHHLNRWYDPVIGKWISEDPKGFSAGDTNISRYVSNRVLSRVDPLGLDEIGVEQELETTGGGIDDTDGTYFEGGEDWRGLLMDMTDIDRNPTVLPPLIPDYSGLTISEVAEAAKKGGKTGGKIFVNSLVEEVTFGVAEDVWKPTDEDMGYDDGKGVVSISTMFLPTPGGKVKGGKKGLDGVMEASSWFKKAKKKVNCGGKIACFVAGTQVMVPVNEEKALAIDEHFELDPTEEISDSRTSVAPWVLGASLVVMTAIATDRKRKSGNASPPEPDDNLIDSHSDEESDDETSAKSIGQSESQDSISTESRDAQDAMGCSPDKSLRPNNDCKTNDITEIGPMRNQTNRYSKWSVALIASLLIGFFCFSFLSDETPPVANGLTATANSHASTSGVAFANIEDLRVGQRVVSDDPTVDVSETTQVDPRTWRLLELEATLTHADGTFDRMKIETLQPQSWIAQFNAVVGSSVPVPLDLAEMGIPDDLKANVISNGPCPKLESGQGRIILTTVNHLNSYLWELEVRDQSGIQQTIETTGYHKFLSRDRAIWLSACNLKIGEKLHGQDREITVLTSKRVPGTKRVYNFTVEGEHVYFVSGIGVLAHNNKCKDDVGSYTIGFASGKKYHGKGTFKRMKKSAKEKKTKYDDPVVDEDWTKSRDNRTAFKDEDKRIQGDGGIDHDGNYNKINSPGKKYRAQDGD